MKRRKVEREDREESGERERNWGEGGRESEEGSGYVTSAEVCRRLIRELIFWGGRRYRDAVFMFSIFAGHLSIPVWSVALIIRQRK